MNPFDVISLFPTTWVKSDHARRSMVKELWTTLWRLSNTALEQAANHREITKLIGSTQTVVGDFDGLLPNRGSDRLIEISQAQTEFITLQSSIVHLSNDVKKLLTVLASRLFEDQSIDENLKVTIKLALPRLDHVVNHQVNLMQSILEAMARLTTTIQQPTVSKNSLALLRTTFEESIQSVSHLAADTSLISHNINANYL